MDTPESKSDSCFLPTNVIPVRYEVALEPDLDKFVFKGEETIEIKINDASVPTIQLHSIDIEIQHAQLDGVAASKIQFDKKEERVTLEFPVESFQNKTSAKLNIQFTGELNDKLAGFYRSKYKATDGTERYMATTQFEATDARRAFPCWDEPDRKAIFSITLTAPVDRVVVSNMPELSREVIGENLVKIKFADTPIMSTYIVAFIIGEFDYVEGKSEAGVLVRIYTPVGKTEQGKFPLQVSLETLTFYEKLFGINFPLPKLDLLAIPDFAAGAMENWGAITYREVRLLIDPIKTSTALKLGNMKTINHEIAHMWFGNLVTMKWWDNLWLNEGFARYMEHVPVAKFYPDYEIWTQFVAGAWTQALDLDGLKTSHPIEVPVKHASEINEIFDSISYAKGASIIRMLATFLGEDVFFKGIHNYLEKHKYDNTVTENLWEALAAASGKPVQSMMNTWTKQMGYPVISVEEIGEAQPAFDGGLVQEIRLTQKRFLSTDATVAPEDEQQWIVPVTLRTSVETQRFLLENKTTTVKVKLGKEATSQWIKINDGSVGFYRVNYTPTLWQRLGAAVKSKVLSPSDRLELLTDSSALSSSGRLSTVEFLVFLLNYSEEEDYSVFSSIIGGLGGINLLLDQEDCYPQVQAFLRNLLRPTLHKIGWDTKSGEPQLYSLLRGLLLTFLGGTQDEEVTAEARKRFDHYLEDKNSIPADVHYPVLKAVARAGDEQMFETFIKLFKETDSSEEQRNFLRALGQFPDEKLIKRALDFAISTEVRAQDIIFLVGSAAHNPKGRVVSWEWLKNNWSTVEMFATGQNFLVSGLISSCTSYFNTVERAVELEEFFKTHPIPSAERTIRQSIEGVRGSAKWLERDLNDIRRWLENYSATSSS